MDATHTHVQTYAHTCMNVYIYIYIYIYIYTHTNKKLVTICRTERTTAYKIRLGNYRVITHILSGVAFSSFALAILTSIPERKQ